MTQKIDLIFTLFKWPVAFLTLLLLPGSIMGFSFIGQGIYHRWQAMLPFLGGFAAYTAGWHILLKHPIMGSLLSTLEHELTHAFFALITGHKVRGIKTTWSSGGEMTSVGGYNWLIHAGPYFFPTFSVLFMILLIVLPLGNVTRFIFGATIAYHMLSTLRETHLGQTDLQKIGYLFSLLFLPAANVLSYGILFAFSLGGWSAVSSYLGSVWQFTMHMVGVG